ncbi:MAG: PKD domain-containing protein [Thermodesulfobacteriota bacterium]
MIRIKSILLTLSLLVVAVGMTAEASTLRKGPYLIYPSNNTEMTVLWQADTTPGTSSIEWGTTPDYGNSSGQLAESGSGTDEHQFTYVIPDLTPGTRYYYSVTVDSQQVEGSFTTAPEDNASDVTIYAYGDTRTYPADQNLVTGALLADIDVDPDTRQTISLHAGDWISNDTEADWQDEFFNRSYGNNIDFMAQVAYMGCRGNHEDNASEFRKYWPYTPGANYYSFDYGPIHITVIDQYVDYSPGSDQYNWIVEDLASSTKPFKIAHYHEPAWSAESGGSYGARNYLQPLFLQYNVQMAINGHSHWYSRAVVDGVQHLTVGGGGAPLYNPDPSAPYVVTAEKTLHFSRLDVIGDTMTVTVIRDDGTVLETFEVYAPLGEPSAFDDEYNALIDIELNVAAPGVLANDYDPQGDTLTALLDTDAGNGTLILNSDGSFDYTPDGGFKGYDTFTYYANDGVNDSPAVTVTINVTDWMELTYDDFESGFGNYTDGGADALIVPYSYAGAYAANIQDNTESSHITLTNPIDVTGFSQLEIDFWFKGYGMEEGENYLVEYFDGSTWQIIRDYVSVVDFPNNVWQHETLIIDSSQHTFPTDMRIRFRCNASDDKDDIDLDEIYIRGKVNGTPPANTPPVASFSYQCTDLDCSFDGSASTDDGTIIEYSWDFGDTSISSGVTPPVHSYATAGIYTVVLTVTDDEDATDSASQKVTVTVPDTQAPTITAPADVSVEATAETTTVSLGSPAVSDDLDPNPTVSNDAPAAFPLGMTTVIWTVTDASGNSASATQAVTVSDTTAPTITAPADISVEFGEIVALGTPAVSDLADPNPTVNNDAPASFPLGMTTVTWTVTDASGNSASAAQTVTVTEPAPQLIELTTSVYKVKGVRTVDLTWSGAAGANVKIYRNGLLLTTTDNDGLYTDIVGKQPEPIYLYQVCEEGTEHCSNEVTVNF